MRGSGRRDRGELSGLGAGCMVWEEESCSGAVRWVDAKKNTEVAGGGSVWSGSIIGALIFGCARQKEHGRGAAGATFCGLRRAALARAGSSCRSAMGVCGGRSTGM
eukprot:6056644-Prorocentrum_lima.AAC.1